MTRMINTLACLILFSNREAKTQTNYEVSNMDLVKTEIINTDNLLSDVAFNQFDASHIKRIIADDIEFYDDRFGLNTSKGNEIKSLSEKCAGTEKLTRKLDSTTIDKLGDFGAVQLGEHTFLVNNIPVGTGKFIHIWER